MLDCLRTYCSGWVMAQLAARSPGHMDPSVQQKHGDGGQTDLRPWVTDTSSC